MARRKVGKDWQHLQERTFTKWFNNVLRGHLTSSDSQVENLQTDLKDGLKLVQLLESLSKEKISGIHKKPNFEPHKIENLSACFRFMEKANIKLVNIGNMDIYNGNMKLILGLIWTLVRRFQIRSMGTALTTKEALLAWVNTQLTDQNVKNFTTDWNDGIALCALIDRIKPGICPQHETLKGGDGLENCKQGMTLAEEELGISRLLEAEDLCHPQVDELSVMTYVSSFCTPANNHLLAWIQSVIPERNITNLHQDWNDGINLSCLLNVLLPGTLPDCHQLDPHQSLDNLIQAMKIGEEYLGVKPVLTPAQLADPKVDELNVATYLSRFQFAKPIPLPHMITCKGHGLFKAISGRSNKFEADCSKGGAGDLAVVVTDSEQHPVEAQLIQKDGDLIEVQYVPQIAGKLTVEVKWSESPVPGSPFHPDVIDLGKFSFTGKQITGGEGTQIGSLVVMEAKGITEIEVSDLSVLIQHSDGHTETAKILLKEDGVIECTYTPTRPGKDEVFVKIAGIDIPGSPFEVKVVDPSQCSVQMVDPSAGQPLIANKPATFTIMASEANLGGITAEVTRPDSSKPDELNVIPQKDGSNVATFTPVEIGEYKVSVTCAGKDIRGSPLLLTASDPGKCEFLDTVPSMIQIGKPSTIRLNVKGAGVGAVEISSSQPSVLTVVTSSDSTEPEIYTIQLTPVSVGEASIDIKWEGNSISPTPCSIQVCDATKCGAYGPSITEGRGKCMIPFEFTVLTKEAGKGELIVKPKGQKATYAAKVTESSDGMYDVSFTTYEVGVHTIDVLWGDAHIPDSPFKVDFVKVGDANQFTVSGDGLKEATAQKAAKCLLVGPTSGLLENNVLQVQVSNEQFKSTMVNKDKFDAKCNDAVVHVSDHGNASYSVEYAVPAAGIYSLSITSDGTHIPGSPFVVNVLAASDASKCRAFGEAIEQVKKPCVFKVNSSVKFGVDITDAGEGNLSITGRNPKGGQISSIFTNDQEQDGKREKHVRYNPEDIGHHILEIKWEGVDIPGSPLDLNVVDPSKCKISDLPPRQEMKPIQFSVTCEGAGKSSPEVSVGAFGSLEMTTLQPSSQSGAVFYYTYTPESFGNTSLSIKFGGFEIPNSPFNLNIIDPNRYSISGLNLEGKYARVSDPIAFDISSKKFNNDDVIDVTQHGPRGEKEHTSLTPKDGKCSHSFTPLTPGAYDIFVECSGVQVSGSPLQVHVVDPQNCKIFGKFPDQFQVGIMEDIVVNTQAAGEGDLQVFFNGAKEHPSINCAVQKQDISSYVMKFNGKQVDSTSVSILWGGFNIKGSPFHVNISDANKCNAIGSVITSKTATTGEAVSFSVETKDAGKGKLTVIPKGPSATYKADIKTVEGKYDVTFTPWEVGQVSLDLLWGKTPIPNSPFIINVENSKNICNATGDGLKTAMVGREASFTVITTEMGLLKKKAMAVSVSGIRVGRLKANVKDNQNGTYTVSYTPHKPGAYVANVEVNKSHILGSPFKINVVSAPDASKCIVGGPASQTNSVHVRGSHPEITVDTSEAGTGKLDAVIEGPNKYRPKVYMSEGVNGLYSIKFQATNPGRYIITLLWSGQEIPGSPFKVRVHPAPDASKVKAYGSGLEDGYIGTPGEFVVDTRNAGIGTITINVHGIKESFKIAAKRSDSDPRIITGRYDPKKKGDYVIRMLWDGVHIPRSPFFVKIRGKPGSRGSDEDVTQAKRMAPDKDEPVKATPPAKPLPVRTKDQDSKVLESAFAKAAPVYDAPQTKKGKKDKSTPKKVKDSKKKKKAQESRTPPPVATVGPVAPNLKMKSNVAMAMALPTPQLVPVPGGKEQPSRVQTGAVDKKTKKTTTPDKGKKAVTGKPEISPKKVPDSTKAKPKMSAKQRTTSPKGQPTSPAKKPTTPEGHPTPTKKSPTKGGPPKSTSPAKQAGATKILDPTQAPVGDKATATKATKPSSPTAKPTSATKPTGSAKPSGSTAPTKISDPSKVRKHTKPKELTGGSATKVSEVTSKSSAASESTGAAKPVGGRATKPTGSTKPSGEHKASGRPTSPKVKQPQPPQHHRSERPTSPVRSKPGVERGSKSRAADGRGGAKPTQSPYQPIERSTSPRSLAKTTEAVELKHTTPTKSPAKVASSRGPHMSTKLPPKDVVYYAPKPKSPRRREMSPESYDGRHFQPPQRVVVRGQPRAGADHRHHTRQSREAGMRVEAVESAYGEDYVAGRRPRRRAIRQLPVVAADEHGGRPTSPQRYMYVRVPIDDTKPPPKRHTYKK